MATSDLEIGSVVMLKSGGVSVTITALDKKAKTATVTWYADKSEEFKTATLPLEVVFAVDFADDEDEVEDD
ncbi:MAG: DUF2158 domain-containing protein [Ancalomicrobiaceae bacterium]|nr:DUF2158 domain-containing protein [Ancalomicrobiaceae bacterium]